MFLVAVVAGGIAYLVGVYSLVRSAEGFEYERIPLPSDLVAARRDLQSYYEEIGEPPETATAEFDRCDHRGRRSYLDGGAAVRGGIG
jgi:hypothetical protein